MGITQPLALLFKLLVIEKNPSVLWLKYDFNINKTGIFAIHFYFLYFFNFNDDHDIFFNSRIRFLVRSRLVPRIDSIYRLVPHVDKAPLPLRIWRLVTSNFLQVENPTHPTAHAPERASVYILGQFRTSKWEMNMYWKLRRFAALSFRYKAFQILLLLVISILIIFSMSLDFDIIF